MVTPINVKLYKYATTGWKDRLISYDGYGITYDTQGNPLIYCGHTLEWSRIRLLTKWDDVEIEYDASGIRTRKGNTTYELDGSSIISETTNGNTIRYYYGNGGIVGFRYNGQRYYYEKNLQGDITAIYDTDGDLVGAYIYDAWGNTTITTNIDGIARVNPFRYRSYYYDSDLGLYYLKSRYYDANIGRFINADSLNYLGADGSLGSYNIFTYCGDNPLILIDSNGKSPTFWETIVQRSKNDDGSYSLYDNNRFWDHGPFHEQFIVVTPSKYSFGPKEGALSLGLGGVEFDLFTGGWEYEHHDVSLFDFGHCEASIVISKNGVDIGVGASLWSPSISFTLFGYTVEIGLEVGAIGLQAKWDNEGWGFVTPGAIGISLEVTEA